MNITNIIGKLPFHNSNGTMVKDKIDTIVIHHEGFERPPFYNSIKRYTQEAKAHIAQGWGHISYHYCIDNAGTVFQCLPETEVAYHCGNLIINKKSIAIKFDGNMMTQKLTAAQVSSYKELMKYLTTQRPDLSKVVKGCERGHRTIKATSCPGKNTTDQIIHTF